MFATALAEGMRTLKQDGIEKVLAGNHRHPSGALGLHQVGLLAMTAAERMRRSRPICFGAWSSSTPSASRFPRETDIDRLLEAILVAAKNITNADGGTLYRVTDERTLEVRDHAQRHAGHRDGRHDRRRPFRSLRSRSTTRTARPVTSMVAAYAVHHDTSVNIADAYCEEGFDFSGHQELRRGRRDTARGRS